VIHSNGEKQEAGPDFDRIVLFGLDEDDADLLLPNIPASDQSREPQDLKPGHKGEPATTLLVIAITAAALKAWVAFLALQGRKRSFKYTFEIQRANGDRKTGTLEISASSGPEVEKDIIKQLAGLGIDTSLLGKVGDGA
jgi:hypothetical protein